MSGLKNSSKWLGRALKGKSGSNLRVIMLCIFGATTFWFLNAMNDTYTTNINYPVNFRYNANKLVPLQAPPQSLPLNVTGTGWNLLRNTVWPDIEPVVYELDQLPGRNSIDGETLMPLLTEYFKQINVNYVVRDSIRFQFDYKTRKKVRLTVSRENIPLASNHIIMGDVQVVPDCCVVHGPSRYVDSIPEVVDLELPGDEIDDDYDREVDLSFLERHELITLSNDYVHVRFDVTALQQKTLRVPVKLNNARQAKRPGDQQYSTKVEYWWPEAINKSPKATDFTVLADMDSLRSDSTLPLYLKRYPSMAHKVSLTTSHLKLPYGPQ